MSMQNEPSSDRNPATEKQLCLKCLTPNEVTTHFCQQCGAPLSSYASTAPFEHIMAQGHAFRQAADSPRRLIVVLGVWVIFGHMALIGIVQLVNSKKLGMGGILFSGFLLLVSIAILWKTTRNYAAWVRSRSEKD